MGKLSLIILFLFSQSLFAKNITIISDLDDTLKMTNVSNWTQAVRNALFSKKAFGEMPMLLEEMESYSNDLYILSASPKILNQRVESFLETHKLNPKEVFLRKIISRESKEEYKTSKVEYVLENSEDDKLILIGDNVELDPVVYTKIQKKYPHRIAAIYIHKVEDKEKLAGTIEYNTAYDIALNEYKAKRMSFLQVVNIGQKILFSRDLEKFLPKFVFCPQNESDFNSEIPMLFKLLTSQVRTKIKKYCANR